MMSLTTVLRAILTFSTRTTTARYNKGAGQRIGGSFGSVQISDIRHIEGTPYCSRNWQSHRSSLSL
jgi:hypothetical protein